MFRFSGALPRAKRGSKVKEFVQMCVILGIGLGVVLAAVAARLAFFGGILYLIFLFLRGVGVV